MTLEFLQSPERLDLVVSRVWASLAITAMTLGGTACGPSTSKPSPPQKLPPTSDAAETPHDKNGPKADKPPRTRNSDATSDRDADSHPDSKQPAPEPPCVRLDASERIEFGRLDVGSTTSKQITITNCSDDSNLRVTGITLTDSAAAAFELPEQHLPPDLPHHNAVLEPGKTTDFTVTFSPQQRQPYEGQLGIGTNAPRKQVIELQLRGVGFEKNCPKPVARGKTPDGRMQSDQIHTSPFRTVKLDATKSRAQQGAIDQYEWRILESPETSSATLSSTSTPKPELYIDSAGHYAVGLEVYDTEGRRSCEEARVKINAIAKDDIRIKLTWHSPKDPNPSNDCGPDLDLHYLHQNGEWNDPKWDIYYKNKTANWGEQDQFDNPTLDKDNISGSGPEQITHSDPKGGVTYRIGVHYYRSKAPDSSFERVLGVGCSPEEPSDYGPAYADVEIFVDGRLTYRSQQTIMSQSGDFWEVAVLEWPSGRVSPLGQMHRNMPGQTQ